MQDKEKREQEHRREVRKSVPILGATRITGEWLTERHEICAQWEIFALPSVSQLIRRIIFDKIPTFF